MRNPLRTFLHTFYKAFTEHPFYSLLFVVGILIFFLMPILFVIGVILVIVYESWSTRTTKTDHTYVPHDNREVPITSGIYTPRSAKQAYLNSKDWWKKKQLILARDNYKCQMCGDTETQLNIHHITYERLGNEDLGDLVCICETCHSALHAELGYAQDQTYPIK